MRISNNFELGKLMTFELSKEIPIHNWFWYKEGYAPGIVDYAIHDSQMSAPKTILDPFCGVGTTLLAAKSKKIDSIGIDASSLASFISRTKTNDYAPEHLQLLEAFLTKMSNLRELGDDVLRKVPWEFELFDPRAAFPRRNYNDLLTLRLAIEQETDDSVRDLLLLALLSVIPQSSIILKDGGVLKIDRSKRAMPAKEIFRRKLKNMIKDLKENSASGVVGHCPQVFVGDARALDLMTETIDLVVTSPPYLNNIDYSKIYGLELSLLSMSKSEAEQVRMRALRSFIGKKMKVDGMPPEVGEIGFRIPIIGTYFRDMEAAMYEMHRTLVHGGTAYVVVSNSVIHQTHVLVDEVLGEIGERIGFSDCEIIVGAERIADVKPQKVKTRESIVKLRK
ncbi:hypothetical protein HY988_06820 [Candidatus Micrarchaeota archaeon]|nr:hypothetical protein [Candidatus Micrarchaeota archaeon]